MIAPTPPAANLDSQLIRVWVSEPSSLSKRPEMLERKIRFLTVRLRNFSGVKIESLFIGLPLRRAPNRRQQRGDPGVRGALRPGSSHERHLRARRAIVGGVKLQQDQRAVAKLAGQRFAASRRLPHDLL